MEKHSFKYLGIKLDDLLDLEHLQQLNLIPLINPIQQQVAKWNMLKLSWFGELAIVKMKILPQLVFLFR